MFKKLVTIVMLATASLFAQAKVVGVATFRDGGVIQLEDVNTRCVKIHKDARDGTYTYPNQRRIVGCWIATPNGIYFADEEGDSVTIPMQAVQAPTTT